MLFCFRVNTSSISLIPESPSQRDLERIFNHYCWINSSGDPGLVIVFYVWILVQCTALNVDFDVLT